MSQFNLLSFSLKEKHRVFNGIQKRLCINKFLEKHRYTTCEKVPVELKKLISDHLKENSNVANEIRTLCSQRGGEVLKKYNLPKLEWNWVEFDQSILIWHIATDVCLHSNWKDHETITSNGEFSQWLSQYMLYLLVICPSMLLLGIGMISVRNGFVSWPKV